MRRSRTLRLFALLALCAVPLAAQQPRATRALPAPNAELEEPWSGPLQLVDETSIDLGVKIARATKEAMGKDYPDEAVDHVLFWMADHGRLGRKAKLLYFCCATPETFLGAQQAREIQLVFESRPEWGGKGGESLSSFVVNGFLPVLRAAWEAPLPVTAE